jgi:hypothetical protein
MYFPENGVSISGWIRFALLFPVAFMVRRGCRATALSGYAQCVPGDAASGMRGMG